MAAIQGLRGAGEFSTDFRPKNYRELFTLMEPNGNAPLNALLAMGSSEPTDDPEYKNFRDELPDRKLTVNGAVADTSTGTITIDALDDGGYTQDQNFTFRAHEQKPLNFRLIYNKRLGYSYRIRPMVKITS